MGEWRVLVSFYCIIIFFIGEKYKKCDFQQVVLLRELSLKRINNRKECFLILIQDENIKKIFDNIIIW